MREGRWIDYIDIDRTLLLQLQRDNAHRQGRGGGRHHQNHQIRQETSYKGHVKHTLVLR